MNQPLRAVHRRAFLGLAFVLPAVLITGLAARRPQVVASSGHSSQLPASAQLVRKSDTLWQKHEIHTNFYSSADSARILYVVLHPVQSVDEPDPLLYWSLTAPAASGVPSQAQLMGAFASDKTFALQLDEHRAGYLILYSGAHQAVIDFARVEKLP
ncbi:MAG: hypothetical protein HY010_16710 [Acidobacteria bacterium]|nr:hypothetical protein [Acidobacteriota bacterium]